MAKKSAIEKNNKRRRMVAKYADRRATLKAMVADKTVSLEDRFNAQLKLNKLPRDASPSRVRNRCEVTGRPRAFYRKLKMSRISLRNLGNRGFVPGMVKSSW
ncbi:MAG TPA: 30S ribosomal protein S14 [Devosia sp.]|nr:30S ribosomal protein S14 [Devosia sp.]